MQGTIAQLVALTVYGNAFLQDFAGSDLSTFQERNTTFKFCEFVQFVDVVGGAANAGEIVYGADVRGWFEALKKDGVRGIKMEYGSTATAGGVSDRMLVGFVGGGGRWLLEARRTGAADFWQGRWVVGERERKDRKIWRVSYGRVFKDGRLTATEREDLGGLREKLKDCLERIAEFSRAQKLDNFTKCFEAGIAKLDSAAPLADVYHFDFAPSGFLPLPARQLLACATDAWVFGAMGSWNDQGFSGQEQVIYEQVSEELYRLMHRVIVAAANSSMRD